MENRKAIEQLLAIRNHYFDINFRKDEINIEAMNMAIKALEKTESGELVEVEDTLDNIAENELAVLEAIRTKNRDALKNAILGE